MAEKDGGKWRNGLSERENGRAPSSASVTVSYRAQMDVVSLYRFSTSTIGHVVDVFIHFLVER